MAKMVDYDGELVQQVEKIRHVRPVTTGSRPRAIEVLKIDDNDLRRV